MSHDTQLDRYKKLLSFIETHFNEDINIERIEEVCFYSYRNINRIFEAIHNETIGKYIKRLRLEKAAQYLKYSEMGVSQIAYQVGFEDRSAFSKAFKKRYKSSPQAFREKTETLLEKQKATIWPANRKREKLEFEIEFLPSFEFLFLEYRGDYHDSSSIEKTWNSVFDYANEKGLISEESIFMTEVIDDAEISDHINSRYNFSIILEKPLNFELTDLFRTKKHQRQKYVKFAHQGSHQSSLDFYQEIFAFWMTDVQLELVDLPILEFYPNFSDDIPEDELITETYVAVS